MSQDSTQSHMTGPPRRGDDGPMSLERRLELLESRFTMPSSGVAAPATSFEAVLGSNSSPSASHHSFSFGAPAGSGSSAVDSNASVASDLPASSVRPKKRSTKIPSLQAVSEAAERQMLKFQAAHSPSPVRGLPFMVHDHERSQSLSVLASPPMSLGSGSNQTLLTAHLKNNASDNRPQVVAESPPTHVSPSTANAANVTDEKPKSARNVLGVGDKRKSIPVKRSLPTVTDMQVPNGKNVTPTASGPESRKRCRLQFVTEAPEQRTSPKQPALTEYTSNSRDRSNPGKSKARVPRNNTLIRDFFGTAIKKGNPANAGTDTEEVELESRKRSASITESNMLIDESPTLESLSTKEFDRLRQKYHRLEQICNDKDEQLKAVSNNQTILHTALKSALSQKEKELAEAKKANETLTSATTRVIEKLIRTESVREANELRQKLASDGARLGRIVYTRTGMRVMENWEEGNASKLLLKRRTELNAKKIVLEERQEATRRAAEQLRTGSNNGDESTSSGHSPDMLGIVEAEESVRLHLDTVRRQEVELADEEQALNDEKVEHIRALKRVASEDASRFRSRPKLHDRYVLLSLLGKGGFSEVWRAYDLAELREVAVKIHQLDPRWSDSKKDNYTKHVSREYEIHRDVRHPRIVSLFDVFEIDNNSFATVLECCNGTDLDTLLKEKRRLPERDARAILIQILSGMQYLSRPSGSRQGIIHYDLKPGNILFDEFGDAKITDFGLSKIVDTPDSAESMELTSQGAGTYWYLPPECFVTHQSVRISNKVDVWSIGVIYYQMLFGKRPFGDGQSQDKVLTDHTMLNAREVHFPDSPEVSKEGKEFVQQCLAYDQAFRPTIGQLCEKSYVLEKRF